ncbi:MAG TPA: hypothetical protein VII75_05410 [Thermoanaerobaculia bacterium]|nr:hypothetical protein [Thermoanaerobaculia bacterium]
MNQNNQDRIKKIAANRPKGGGAASKSASLTTTNPVTFQDWLFFGTEPDIFVNVGIVPNSSSVVVTYAVVVIQTPDEYILSDATFAPSNPTESVPYNLATDSGTFSISQYGNQVEAWAFVQTNEGDQYSDTQSYTVSS